MSNQNIDSIIQIAQEQESSAHGSNKKCYLIDDYALLEQSFTIEEVESIMHIGEILKGKGIRVARTLDYKVINQTERKWKNVPVSEGYVLQQRAQGTPLLDRTNRNDENNRYQLDYLRQIDSISREGQDFFDSFVNGWIEIQKSGIRIDPSKPGNFIYEQGKGITFIDLGLTDKETDMPTQVYEQLAVILNLDAYYKCYPEIQEAVQKRLDVIIGKYRDAILTHGIDSSIVDEIIEAKTPRRREVAETQIEETPDEEMSRLEGVIDGYIKEENKAREEARRLQAEREERARIEKQRRAEAERRLEEEDERKNGGKRLDSKMYALLNGLIKDGIIPADKAEAFKQVFTRKTNIYRDLNPDLFRKQGTSLDLNSVVPNLGNNSIGIDMITMQFTTESAISSQDYEQITTVVQDYFRQYFENIANSTESKLSEYSKMKEMHESGTLSEEQYVEFRLLETELTEFSQAQELFSYFGIQDKNVLEQSKKISEFLQKQNEMSEEDIAKEERRRRQIAREYLDAAFRDTGITDPKAITPSQIRKLTVQAGTGITDINNVTEEMRNNLELKIEKPKEFVD